MASQSTLKKWLITGASQGLGLAMTLAALKAGHKVVACARDPTKAADTYPDVEKTGGKWLKLDVTAPETKNIVAKASEDVGGFDVVINNAGYVQTGTIEELDEEEMQLAFSTLFWGPIRVLKGALPSMRARKSGLIIHIGSILGVYAPPGVSMYACPKAALDMLQECIGIELEPLNIKTITIQAGLFKTAVMTSSKQPTNGFSEVSMDPKGATVGLLGAAGGIATDPDSTMPGDPAKFAERVVEIVDDTGLGKGLGKRSRILFGRDAVKMSSIKMKEVAEDYEASRDIAYSTDFDGHTSEGVAVVTDFIQKR